MLALAALGCAPASPAAYTVSLSRPLTVAEGLDSHHATVAVVPDPPAPGAPAAWVAYNERPLGPAGGWVSAWDVDGEQLALVQLARGGRLAKPDVGIDAEGRVLVAYAEPEIGVSLEVADGPDAGFRELLAPPEETGSGASPDLAPLPDGGAAVVWYHGDGDRAWVRAAGVDAALVPAEILPAVVAEVENPGIASADADADPRGDGVLVSWADPRDDAPDTLVLQRWRDGAAAWTTRLDRTDHGGEPRRPTVAAGAHGQALVGWRSRAEPEAAPSDVRLGLIAPDGTVVVPPVVLDPADGDDLVVALVGEEAAWVVWTRRLDPPFGTIVGGLLSLPDLRWLVPPAPLSPAEDASRPHTAVADWGEGRWGVAVSWEEGDTPDRRVRGRFGTIRLRAGYVAGSERP
ncbi:MAG: hypothetical protein R3F59_06455 [Myxococcota bacterium]